MLQGTLDLLILRTLVLGPAHGQAIAHAIERGSDDVLQVAGGVIGLALAVALSRWIASLLFGLTPLDPLTYFVSGGMIAAAALLASYVPARQAAAVDPAETLRAE